MTALLAVAALLLLVQTVVLLANVAYWRHRRPDPPAQGLRLSVLIPVRNERDNLPTILAALAAQQPAPWEVLVCDDASDDGTDDWLEAHAAQFGAQWFRAPGKPEGWVGKCWACHQLGLRATGDWMLFLDADVTPGPGFLAEMMSMMAGTDAVLITALPRFAPTSAGDGMLTAMVPFSVFSLLPLARAENDRREAFAFANGQVIGFRVDEYRQHRPHEQVRDTLLEDVALARWAKRLGRGVLIADATRTLSVRMYRGLADALRGFGRTGVPICGGVTGAIVVVVLLALAYLVPWAAAATGDWFGLILGLQGAGLYGFCAARFGLGWWYALLTPPAVTLTLLALARSILWHRRGRVPWRGRTYEGLGSRR
ncbi:MAG: glycosyltransferase [Armatimonadetes bacterium]|nr:glycosyltransferase [Armatimonadota bacterium]